MSKMLNLKIHNNDAKPVFFEDVTQRHAIWANHHKPKLAKLGGIHLIEWDTSFCAHQYCGLNFV